MYIKIYKIYMYKYIYICKKRNHCAVHLKLTQHCKLPILQLKKKKPMQFYVKTPLTK